MISFHFAPFPLLYPLSERKSLSLKKEQNTLKKRSITLLIIREAICLNNGSLITLLITEKIFVVSSGGIVGQSVSITLLSRRHVFTLWWIRCALSGSRWHDVFLACLVSKMAFENARYFNRQFHPPTFTGNRTRIRIEPIGIHFPRK